MLWEPDAPGAFDSRDGSLCGVTPSDGRGLDRQSARWNRSDAASRKVLARGIDLLAEHARRRMNIIRLWVIVDAVDPFANYAAECG